MPLLLIGGDADGDDDDVHGNYDGADLTGCRIKVAADSSDRNVSK